MFLKERRRLTKIRNYQLETFRLLKTHKQFEWNFTRGTSDILSLKLKYYFQVV